MRRFLALLSSCSLLLSVLYNEVNAQNENLFANPVLAGFYPDPSICKAEDNFYLVTSTFSYFPGLPVFQSKDLVNWKLIGHILDRAGQLNLDGQGVSRGLFAPAIEFNEGLFYVVCTMVDLGGNFVVTSDSPEGPWSDPVFLPEINGIDPSLFFDDDGKSYLVYNSVAPDNKPLYEGHRTLRIREFDKENLKVTGEEHIIVNGGVDLSKNPVWIEAPHIYTINNYYYLIAAEGGTADQHSEVVFRSENIFGPYIPYENNPILTQRHLDPSRKNPVTTTGHADIVQLDNGEWWAVFLGCRPYSMEGYEHYNTGRETFLAPVKWIKDKHGIEWPVINPDYEEVQYYYPYPLPPFKENVERPYGGNFKIKYDFDKTKLERDWMFLRTLQEKWYDLNDDILSVDLRPQTCSGLENPSFLGHRQQHIKCSVSTATNFNAESENEKAGLLIFLNEKRFYFLCKSVEGNQPVVQLYKSVDAEDSEEEMELLTSVKIDDEGTDSLLKLKISADKNDYSFFYAFNDEWILLKDKVDASYLNVRIPRDFTGCIFALYSTSSGIESSSKAYYDWFEYEGYDNVYKN